MLFLSMKLTFATNLYYNHERGSLLVITKSRATKVVLMDTGPQVTPPYMTRASFSKMGKKKVTQRFVFESRPVVL